MRHELQYTIVARYLRLIPLEWSAEGRVGLRVEVYGCAYCECKLEKRLNFLVLSLRTLDSLLVFSYSFFL